MAASFLRWSISPNLVDEARNGFSSFLAAQFLFALLTARERRQRNW